MRIGRKLVSWFVRFWPLRGGLVYPVFEENVWQSDRMGDQRPRRKLLYIPTDAELAEKAYIRQLARDLSERGLSRRKVIDWVADEVFGFNGHFVTSDGKVIPLEDVDDVFGEPSFKWVSDFVKWEVRVPAQAIQQKIIPRIRYLAMARAAERDRED